MCRRSKFGEVKRVDPSQSKRISTNPQPIKTAAMARCTQSLPKDQDRENGSEHDAGLA
jgi:hypothetical protein